jgi:DNA end-binding protein Ku
MVAIRPKDGALVMSSLFYADEVRSLSGIEEIQDPPEVNAQELALAAQLIDSITQPFDPKQFQDQYRNAVLDVIKAKVEGREIVEPPQVETGKVINLMEALKSSLERTQADSTSQPGEADEKELSATGTDSASS